MLAFARNLLFAVLVALYGVFFIAQEKRTQQKDVRLELALPSSFYAITSGYLKQLVSEMLFVRTGVFLGGVRPGIPPITYENELGNNFAVMTELYPNFIDPYYYCQAFLATISVESTTTANAIFATGISAKPDDLMLRFFHANSFLTMDEPLKAAEAYLQAAKLQNAPAMFGHLAALLSAQGGDIIAGLISLEAMLNVEKNDIVRNRYQEEIAVFKKALDVQRALNAYIAKYASAPRTLEQLTPEFIQRIPEIGDSFVLHYTPPNLHLKRPDRSKK